MSFTKQRTFQRAFAIAGAGSGGEMPLLPELRELLLQAKAEAAPDAKYVIIRYRDPASNLRSQFLRILDAAGLTPWPKIFQNMRSTRQTELTEIFPEHVVCAWLGNTEKIAKGHYLQPMQAHFDKAAGAIADQRVEHRNDKNGGDKNNANGDETGGAKSGAANAGLASHDAALHFDEKKGIT